MDRKVDHKNILFLLVAIFHIAARGMTTGCGDNKNMIQASSLTNGRVTLTWDSIPQFAAYEVYLSTTPGVSVQNAFRISDVSSPFTITDLQPGITYYFVVTAVDESGQRKYSKEVAYRADSSEGNIHFDTFTALAPPE